MTRQDYQLIASEIKAEYELPSGDCQAQERNAIRSLALRLAGRLKDDNPRFNEAKFLLACGMKGL